MNKFTPNGKQQCGFHPGDSWRTPNFTSDLTKCVSPKGDLDLTGFYFLDGNQDLMVDTVTTEMTLTQYVVDAIKNSTVVSLNETVAEHFLDKNPELFDGKELYIE